MSRILSMVMIVLTLCSLSLRGATGTAPAGFWRGTGRAVRVARLGVVTITCTYSSRFWFVVETDHTIHGQATVEYQLDFDDKKLRSLLAHANWADGAPLGMVPAIGGLLGSGLATRDAIGMRMAYRETAPVREGAIRGQVTDRRIHLEWAQSPGAIPYNKFVVYPLKERALTPADHPAYSPWLADAAISEPTANQLAAATPVSTQPRRNGQVTTVTRWSAEQRPTR